MAAITNYLENALVDHVLRGIPYASPISLFVGLFLTDPTDAGGGIEVAGGGYVRQNAFFGAPVDGVSLNTNLITFPVALADWGVIPYAAILDAAFAGNMLFHCKLADAELVLTGDTFSVLIGNLAVSLA
jgi:hypothetical protein